MTRSAKLATLAACALATAAVPAAAQARTLNVRDEGRLGYVRSSGSQILDEGTMHGNLPGHAQVHFLYNGNPNIAATFIIWAPGWSLRGSAHGKLSSPFSNSPSFRGRMTISGGSGRFAHAGGSGELFGVFYRRSYGLVVQAITRVGY